jgi:hypothetical protein
VWTVPKTNVERWGSVGALQGETTTHDDMASSEVAVVYHDATENDRKVADKVGAACASSMSLETVLAAADIKLHSAHHRRFHMKRWFRMIDDPKLSMTPAVEGILPRLFGMMLDTLSFS